MYEDSNLYEKPIVEKAELAIPADVVIRLNRLYSIMLRFKYGILVSVQDKPIIDKEDLYLIETWWFQTYVGGSAASIDYLRATKDKMTHETLDTIYENIIKALQSNTRSNV